MPSRLRNQTVFEDVDEIATVQRRSPSPPQKKQKMSLSQTYFIAASARSKLGKEACKPDHNLRLLVGHANLLDTLMMELHDAEREQEAWFNTTVQRAVKAEEPKHIQWLDQIGEDEDEDEDMDIDDAAYDSSDSSDDDDDADEFEIPALPRRIRQAPVNVSSHELDSDDEFEDDEDDLEHALVRTASGTSAVSPPPELVDDSDSDDESPPASPPAAALEFTETAKQQVATTALFAEKLQSIAAGQAEADVTNSNYLIASQNHTPLIAAC